MTYDGRDLEIMTTGNVHDYFKYVFGVFVHEVATALAIRMFGRRTDDLEAS